MTTPSTINLFGFPIASTSTKNALNALLRSDTGKKTAAFINAHCINTAAEDTSYRWALSKADLLLPDGIGIEIAARLNGNAIEENLNGTDLYPHLCREAARRKMPIFLLGSRPGVAEAAADRGVEIAEGLTIAGTRDGFFDASEESDIIADINASGAKIVLVALGVPRQDVWIARNRHRLDATLVMGVGAQFDFWSGKMPRAPQFLRDMRLEWAFRLAMEPRRLAKRYLWGNGRFLLRAFADRKLKEVPTANRPGGIARAVDVTIACGVLLGLSPVMLLLAAAIKIDSKGPVLFKQTRVGQGGAHFGVFKFRSMHTDATERLAEVLHLNDRDSVFFKARRDPRVTRVGRFLRRFSLDELPQIFNVLKGEMSIVGPRPSLPTEVAEFPAEAMSRLDGKPGITGVWQVSGRAEIRFEKMIEMDRAYVSSPSLLMDFAILLLTMRAVISGRGAY